MVSEYTDITQALFSMRVHCPFFKGDGIQNPSKPINTFVFNEGPDQWVKIDEIEYLFESGAVLLLMSSQNFVFENTTTLIVWQFNKEFYCIVDHDAEVGCAGFLFYGIQQPMFVRLKKNEQQDIAQMAKMFVWELTLKDNFQGETLRTLLKYLIIKITRIAKLQSVNYQKFSDEKLDIIRKFSVLLERKYKTEHTVAYYASELNRSPKTLSNIFALLEQESPSKIIFNRIILEAKRYFYYSDKSAKEIAFELGFESPAHFSRFFKNQIGMSITLFKEKMTTSKDKFI